MPKSTKPKSKEISEGKKESTKTSRNPELTRTKILEAAGKLLATHGPEGLGVSLVAQMAGVNRGTAYQHFRTREQLLRATTTWVSERLCTEVFGSFDKFPERQDEISGSQIFINQLIDFAMKHPELGRVWLMTVLSSSDPSADPFWALYKAKCDEFAASDVAQPGIDTEVQAAIVLMSAFLWPVWARAHAQNEGELNELSKRYSREILRLSLHGTLRPGAAAKLESQIAAGDREAH